MNTKMLKHLFIIVSLALAESAGAGAIRLDAGGDWELVVSGSGTDPVIDGIQIGFDIAIFGASGDEVSIGPNGSASLSGGPISATFDVLDSSLLDWTAEATNDDFLVAGVEDGFRVTWSQSGDPIAQLAMFVLSGGGNVLEFNYNGTIGGTDIGYSVPDDGVFYDLLTELGLELSELPLFNSFNGGPPGGLDTIPDFAGGYFRLDASSGEETLGRYIWLVPEPPIAALFSLGLVMILVGRRKRFLLWVGPQ